MNFKTMDGTNLKLRSYQSDGIKQLYSYFRDGVKRILWVAPTGAGKTFSFLSVMKEAYAANMNIVIIVKRRSIIFQTSRQIEIDHGVYMGDHEMFSPDKRIQVCSIDTIGARKVYPHGNDGNTLIVVDEAHDISSRVYKETLEHYKNDFVAGFTATPYKDNSFWDMFIQPITAKELRDQGYLLPIKTFVPNLIDVSKVKIRAGDYVQRELQAACSESSIVGDIVETWIKYAKGLRTVLFAVNVEHSKIMVEAFNNTGVRAVHADAKTPQKERDRIIKQLENREIDLLSNVNIFSTGVDIPPIECIDFCRPTQSLIYWIQAVGRGVRTFPGIKECMLLDHAGNTYRHGDIYMDRETKLNGRSGKISEEGEITFRTCDNCFFIYRGEFCPMCEHENDNKNHTIKVKDGELVEYFMSEQDIEQIKYKEFETEYTKLNYLSKNKGFKENWKYYKLLNKYGLEFCVKHGGNIGFPNFLLK